MVWSPGDQSWQGLNPILGVGFQWCLIHLACPENGSPLQWPRQDVDFGGPSEMKTLFSKRSRICLKLLEAWISNVFYIYIYMYYIMIINVRKHSVCLICARRMCIHMYYIYCMRGCNESNLYIYIYFIIIQYCICTHAHAMHRIIFT